MSALPPSFLASGFTDGDTARFGTRKYRRLMIGCDGPPDSGKSEFSLSCPGPGLVIGLDRGIDSVLDNPNPPPTRRNDYGFKVVEVPKATQFQNASDYAKYWGAFYLIYMAALANPDARTLVLDGDSDSWELQRLAEFGRLAKVPPNLYDTVNAARRAMYSRAYDSGKIIVATNRVRKVYAERLKADGSPEINASGNAIREWTGDYERQGFSDQEYLWNIQLRHMMRDKKGNGGGKEWGIRITKCKADPSLVGMELWGQDCCFRGLVETVYPHIPVDEWGL